jgi:thioredoxin-like negative regulator of GroEL
MAALQVIEDRETGRLTMRASLASRLGSLVFGLMWVAVIAIAVLPDLFRGEIDWFMLIFFAVFALFPLGGVALATMFGTTVEVDRSARTLTRTRHFFGLPLLTTVISFADLVNIQVQGYRQAILKPSSPSWFVVALTRDGARVRLNWGGTYDEMNQLAQKVSAVTGVAVTQSDVKLPAFVRQILEKISEQVSPDAGAPEPRALDEYAPPRQEVYAGATTADSIAELEQRVRDDSVDADARYRLARALHAQGQLDRAISLYQQVVRLDTLNANAQNDLGVALVQRGKRTAAEAVYRRAAALDPFFGTAHLNLALLLRDLNRATEASQEFFLARQNARDDEERRIAEAASSGARVQPRLSKT